jgi:hypothetical protein
MQQFYDNFLIEQCQNLKQKLNLQDLKANLMKYFQQYYLFIQFLSFNFNNLFQFETVDTETPNKNEVKQLKLFTKSENEQLSEKTEQNIAFFSKILNQLLDSYLNLTQISDNESEEQQQNLQNYTQTFLISFMDIIQKLTQSFNQNSSEINFILNELGNIICKLFDLNYNLKTLTKNQTSNELEIKLILKYFNQTFINSKKYNDHFEHLFNELSQLLQNKLIVSSYDCDTAKKLSSYEPIIYSLFKYSNLKPQLRPKIVNTWNLTFGKCINESLCYSKRLEKCFYELNNDSSIILLNTTATLTNNNDNKEKKLAISLPGFHNCENIIANAAASPTIVIEKAKLVDRNNKENSPIITNDASLSVSSSVPIVQLIQTGKKRELELILTDDDTGDSDIMKNVKQITSPTNTKPGNFVFSPAGSAGRKSYHQFDQQKSSPLINNQQILATNSATKRKLDLNNLIDQMPDKDFIKISDVITTTTTTTNVSSASPLSFKAPLTEHQKEVKKSKAFIPSESIDLISSTLDHSMSCTLDFDESN